MWILSQKYVIRLLQRLIFAIEWLQCASKHFLLLVKLLLLGDALATITYTMDPFCSDKNLVLSDSQHLSQDLHSISVFIVQINVTNWNAIKITKLFANIIRSCRFVVDRGRHFVAIPLYHGSALSHHFRPQSHRSGTSQHTRTFWRTVPEHFVAPNPPRFAAPHQHILTHQTRTFRRTVPAHYVAHRTTWYSCKRGSVGKWGLVAKRDTVCKTNGLVAKRGSVAKQG